MTKHTSSHSLLPDLVGPGKATGSKKTSLRGSSLVSQSLPALPGAKPSFTVTAAIPATAEVMKTPERRKKDDPTVAAVVVVAPGTSDSINIDTPEGNALIAAASEIPSPSQLGVDDHISQFLDEMGGEEGPTEGLNV